MKLYNNHCRSAFIMASIKILLLEDNKQLLRKKKWVFLWEWFQ